jgi:hypothetical protein
VTKFGSDIQQILKPDLLALQGTKEAPRKDPASGSLQTNWQGPLATSQLKRLNAVFCEYTPPHKRSSKPLGAAPAQIEDGCPDAWVAWSDQMVAANNGGSAMSLLEALYAMPPCGSSWFMDIALISTLHVHDVRHNPLPLRLLTLGSPRLMGFRAMRLLEMPPLSPFDMTRTQMQNVTYCTCH